MENFSLYFSKVGLTHFCLAAAFYTSCSDFCQKLPKKLLKVANLSRYYTQITADYISMPSLRLYIVHQLMGSILYRPNENAQCLF